MTVTGLMPVAEAGFELWLAALAIIVVWQLLTNPERLNGLLSARPDGFVEPERVQGLLVMASAAGAYLFEGVRALGATPLPPHLPEISQTWLTVLTGSQALYLAGKIGRNLS